MKSLPFSQKLFSPCHLSGRRNCVPPKVRSRPLPVTGIIHHSLGDHMLFITFHNQISTKHGSYYWNWKYHIEKYGMKPVIPVSEVNAWVNKPLNNSTIEDFTSNIVGLNFQDWRWNPGKKEDLRTRRVEWFWYTGEHWKYVRMVGFYQEKPALNVV